MADYKPGETVPKSGIYGLYSSAGRKENEATCVKGEPFPPTPRSDMFYRLVRATQ